MANADRLPWLAEEWARQLAQVFESMTGETASIQSAPHELAAEEIDPGNESFFWWEQHFSITPADSVWIGAGSQTWEEIGKRVLRNAGVEDTDRESIRGTYSEIINQALSGITGTLSARARTEVSCTDGRNSPPGAAPDGAATSFEITLGDGKFSMLGVFSNSLLNLDAPAPTRPQPPPTSAAGECRTSNSIDLLLDVELPVSISFGRAQLALKDVIKLTTGSIVELNRALTEPVEVIVNNCVIARGEVVVVEGNYGIRIKNVVSRQERLRTLI